MVSPLFKTFLRLCLLFLPLPLAAQSVDGEGGADVLDEFVEQASDIDEVETTAWEANYEQLAALATQKIDINNVTREDLAALPFLSEAQINDICDFVQRYAPIRSIGELAMIESIDAPTRRLLQSFVVIGEEKRQRTSLNDALKYSKSLLTLTADIPCYERQGDKAGYAGYPYRHSLRYSFYAGQHIRAGFVAAQDAGEPFFANCNRWGYDYVSPYVMVKKWGRIKSLVVGQYRLRMAQGLIMGNNFAFGRLMTLSHLGRTDTQLAPHSSRMEADALQGIGATVACAPYIDITLFASHRSIDTTLDGDSTSDDAAIRNILKTGYHRTASEIERRHNASETMGGGNISFRKDHFHLSANAVYYQFSRPLRPDTAALFRRYQASGKRFWNASLGYAYQGGVVSFSGETAISPSSHLSPSSLLPPTSTINMLTLKPRQDLSFLILQRFYSYRYVALHAQSFGFVSNVQNESGIYLGANWQATRRLSFMAYADAAHFPWARYLADRSSNAFDALLQADYSSPRLRLTARYRIRTHEKNNEDHSALDRLTEQRARLQMTVNAAPFKWKSQVDFALADNRESTSFGFLAAQSAAYRQGRLSLNAAVVYFHTHDYDSRLYLQEPHMRYAFTSTMLYGHGIRYALFADYALSDRLSLRAKVATTDYFDRSTIGTALQRIDHSSQTDLSLQLHCRL